MEQMDVDAPSTSEAAQQPAVQQQFTLNVLQVVKTAQSQNGIKHGDHMRYRRHCANRLHGLFKALKWQHGRTKFQHRKLEPHHVTDVRFLHMPLFNAERAWAYAMELKKDIEQEDNKRKRQHLVARLAKAHKWAAEAAMLVGECCDTKSALEAQAYAAWMHGNLLLEKESDWGLALAKYSRAKTLFEELAKAVSLDQQGLCLQQVEEIEPAIRYCQHQIGRQGGIVPDMKELLSLADQEGRGGLELLQSKLSALAKEAQAQAAASTSFLDWQGRRYAVRAERVKLSLHQANEFSQQLAATAAPAGEASEAQLALYDKIVNAYSEARAHLRHAAKASTASEGSSAQEEMAALETAISGAAMERTIDRTQLLVTDVEGRFAASLERTALGKRPREAKGEGSTRLARAEEVVRQLEILGRNYQDLADLAAAKLGGRQGEALHDECAAKVAAVQAARCYYVAHAYLASEKPLEAYALFQRASERIASARSKVQELSKPDAGVLSRLAELDKQLAAYRIVANAEHAAAVLKEKESVQKGVGGMSLAEQQQQQLQGEQSGYLLDALEQWESFAGQPGAKAPRVFRAPLPLQAVPVRPIMLDTASNLIQYPSLDHRLKKGEKKGYLSSVTSMFSWRRQ